MIKTSLTAESQITKVLSEQGKLIQTSSVPTTPPVSHLSKSSPGRQDISLFIDPPFVVSFGLASSNFPVFRNLEALRFLSHSSC